MNSNRLSLKGFLGKKLCVQIANFWFAQWALDEFEIEPILTDWICGSVGYRASFIVISRLRSHRPSVPDRWDSKKFGSVAQLVRAHP